VIDPKAPGVRRTNSAGRRTLSAGAVIGLAGTAVAAGAAPASAAAVPLDWYNVRDHGATGNGSDDDTAAIQAAITAAATADGGTVYFPAGKYKVTPTTTGPALSIGGNGVRLVGAGSKAAMLVKATNGTLLRMSGAPADTTGNLHRRYCSIENLGFNGNSKTGLLLELYYNDNSYFRDVYLSSNRDLCIDAVEFWDSRFHNLVIEESAKSTSSTPGTLISSPTGTTTSSSETALTQDRPGRHGRRLSPLEGRGGVRRHHSVELSCGSRRASLVRTWSALVCPRSSRIFRASSQLSRAESGMPAACWVSPRRLRVSAS
jgi:hypothetical protein